MSGSFLGIYKRDRPWPNLAYLTELGKGPLGAWGGLFFTSKQNGLAQEGDDRHAAGYL